MMKPLPALFLATLPLVGCAATQARTTEDEAVEPAPEARVDVPTPGGYGGRLEPLPWEPVGSPGRYRARPTLRLTSPGVAAAARQESLRERLDRVNLAGLRVDADTSLTSVMDYISQAAGVNVYVHPDAEDAVADAGIEIHLDRNRPISVRSALDLVTELAGDDVAWTTKHGVVMVTTPERARGEPKTYVYDVSDLLVGVQSFPGRDFNVNPSGGVPVLDEDFDDERAPIVEESILIDLIRQTVAPGTWDDGRNSITIRGGKLIVTHD